jgi:hypothetical protein
VSTYDERHQGLWAVGGGSCWPLLRTTDLMPAPKRCEG